MSPISSVLCVAVVAVATTHVSAIRVPGGMQVPEGCIKTVENNVFYDADKPTSSTCDLEAVVKAPEIQIYASDVHILSSDPLTSFIADWIVPPLPAKDGGQVVYFWPGFKAQKPEMGLPVLQPVLQFGEGSPEWQFQSWFVDGNNPQYPVVRAPGISCKPGDKLTSFMSQSSDGKMWTVSGSNVDSGKNSTLHIAFEKAGNTQYDYAMLVNENINVNDKCVLMPASTNVTFTKVSVNGKQPDWTTRQNCAGNWQCNCDNKATVASNGDVELSWKP